MEELKDLLVDTRCDNGSKGYQSELQHKVSCKRLERLTSEALPGRKSRE
jgi:hypothetical protein